MKNEQQQLYTLMQHFIGMQKIEVLDLLQELEILLFEVSSPVTKTAIREAVLSNTKTKNTTDGFLFTILPNGNFCNCIAQNDWLYLYKEQRLGVYKYPIFDRYYFKLKNPFAEITLLTEENLKDSFINHDQEVEIHEFLRKNRRWNSKKRIRKLLALRLY